MIGEDCFGQFFSSARFKPICSVCQTQMVVMSLQLVIRPVGDDAGQAIASLYKWLSRDASVARYGQVTVGVADQQPGDMGAAVDVINAVFADAGGAAGIGSLLVAFRAWRDTRTQAPIFTIHKEGVTIELAEGSEEECRRVLSVLLPDGANAHPAGITEGDSGDH